jgi:hypothetical protein
MTRKLTHAQAVKILADIEFNDVDAKKDAIANGFDLDKTTEALYEVDFETFRNIAHDVKIAVK